MNMEFEQETQEEVVTGTQLAFEEPKAEEKEDEPVVPEPDDNNDDLEVPTSEDEGQLELFPEDKPKPKPAPAKPKPQAKAPVEEKVGTDYTVYYAGHKIPVPKDDMTLEELRQYLVCDFPEMSKKRATFDVDKEMKEIVPAVNGTKRG